MNDEPTARGRQRRGMLVVAVILAAVLGIADRLLAARFPAWFAGHPSAVFAARAAALVTVFSIANFGLPRLHRPPTP